MANRVAIAGIGLTNFKSKRSDVNVAEMVNEAVRAALADAQLSIKEVEAVVTGNMEYLEFTHLPDHCMAAESGAFTRSGFRLSTGGTSGGSAAVEGFTLVASGLVDIALVIGFQKQDTVDSTGAITTTATPVWGEGLSAGAISEFAKQALTYMQRSGAKEEHAAMIRLKADKGACRNPHAHLRLGLKSIDEILQSGYLIWPIRLLDFCPQSCGACALVYVSEHKVGKITNKPVWIADTVTVHQETFRAGIFDDITGREVLCEDLAAEKLYKRNGITNPRRDICMAELYEPSNWEEMNLYEHLHFCEKNEGWKLVEKGITEIEGEFPVNASGGVIATNAIGATPVVRIAEAALQVRGDAGDHQVTRDVHTAVATALGGPNWTIMTLLKRSL